MAPHERAIAAVVYNPTKITRDELESAVAPVALAAGFGPTLWLETTPEDAGGDAARRALAAGAQVVMAAGGDGTVREVAEQLRSSDIPLALLPSGTGNVLALNLDMGKFTLERAVDVAFHGITKKIDVGQLVLEDPDGHTMQHTFLVAAGLGLDAATMEETRPQAKQKVGVLAYAEGGLRAVVKSKRTPVRIGIDDRRPFTEKVHMVLVANCGSFPPSLVLLPDASIDDGILDVLYIGPRSFWGWLRLWGRVAIDNRIILHQRSSRRGVSWRTWKSKAFEYARGHAVTIHPETPLPCQIDGDTFGEATRMRFWIDPASLAVRVHSAKSA